MSMSGKGAVVAKTLIRRNAAELAQLRELLIQRAALERYALRATTEELQAASDGIVRIAATAVELVRRFWLPLGALAVAAMFRRVGPVLRVARTALTLWQTARLLRPTHRE
jgi:hypothetical protein